MTSVLLSLSALLPLLMGLLLAIPVFLLLRRLWRHRRLRLALRRLLLLRRGWQPVFLERYPPQDSR